MRALARVTGAFPSISVSSGSASTVTRIFQGLKFCSDTVRNGEEGALSKLRELVCACLFVCLIEVTDDCLDAGLQLPCATLPMVCSLSMEVASGSGESRSRS